MDKQNDNPARRVEDRPRLLDLFCGAGGCSVGYFRAGFAPYGIDNNPKPLRHYPFPHICIDALEAMDRLLKGEGLTFSNGETLYLADFAAFHASPKCEKYSSCVHPHKESQLIRAKNPNQIPPTRESLIKTGKPFVIENVVAAPLTDYIKLDGTMFGLTTIKERAFECHGFIPPMFSLACPFNADGLVAKGIFAGIMRHGKNSKELTKREHLAAAYKIDWYMTRDELREAIPPAYTEYIGKYLMQAVRRGSPDIPPPSEAIKP